MANIIFCIATCYTVGWPTYCLHNTLPITLIIYTDYVATNTHQYCNIQEIKNIAVEMRFPVGRETIVPLAVKHVAFYSQCTVHQTSLPSKPSLKCVTWISFSLAWKCCISWFYYKLGIKTPCGQWRGHLYFNLYT